MEQTDMNEWVLAEPLAKDTMLIGVKENIEIRLMNHQDFPWLVLVPRVLTGEGNPVSELFELTERDQITVLTAISQLSQQLKKITQCDKINVAWLGNRVAQLHVHIVARFRTDWAWPNVVFGAAANPYSDQELPEVIDYFREQLSMCEYVENSPSIFK